MATEKVYLTATALDRDGHTRNLGQVVIEQGEWDAESSKAAERFVLEAYHLVRAFFRRDRDAEDRARTEMIARSAQIQAEWSSRAAAIQRRVYEYLKSQGYPDPTVQYSAYTMDDNDYPVDNLDEVAVKGNILLLVGNSWNRYYNPTWLELCKPAEDNIRLRGDHDHIYFESIRYVKDGYYVFEMGS